MCFYVYKWRSCVLPGRSSLSLPIAVMLGQVRSDQAQSVAIILHCKAQYSVQKHLDDITCRPEFWQQIAFLRGTVLAYGLMIYVLQLGSSDELEGKFAKLEGDDVDQELSEMKKGLLTGNKSKQSLPEGRSQGKSEGRPYK